jgi:hypothetical protein
MNKLVIVGVVLILSIVIFAGINMPKFNRPMEFGLDDGFGKGGGPGWWELEEVYDSKCDDFGGLCRNNRPARYSEMICPGYSGNLCENSMAGASATCYIPDNICADRNQEYCSYQYFHFMAPPDCRFGGNCKSYWHNYPSYCSYGVVGFSPNTGENCECL